MHSTQKIDFNRRRILGGLLALTVASGCERQHETASPARANRPFRLRYQGTPGFVSFPELAEELGYFPNLQLDYQGSIQGGPQDLQALVSRDVDVATGFNGAIIKLKAAGVDVVAVVGSYGSDENTGIGFYVKEDSPIGSARDLIGKKIAVNTLGAHAELTLKEYLYRGGLSRDEVAQVEMLVLPPVNSEQAVRAGQVDVAQLYSILKDKALARGGLRRLFQDTDLFGDFTAGAYVFTRDFIARQPAVVATFTEGTARAIEWARSQPREAVIARMETLLKARGRNEDASLARYWKSTGIAGTGGRIAPAEFQRWIDWLARDGQLPGGGFAADILVDNRFNPFQNDPAEKPAQPTGAPT